MRTPEEILDQGLEKLKGNGFVKIFYARNREKALELIKSIQDEAYEQGKEDERQNLLPEREG